MWSGLRGREDDVFFFLPFVHTISGRLWSFLFLLIFSYNTLRYQAFRVTKTIDTLPTLATIDKRK